MRDQAGWVPTKFVQRGESWTASGDRHQVSVGSRIMAARIAAAYTTALRAHAAGDLLDLGCGQVPLYGAYSSLVKTTTCVDWPNSLHGSRHVDLEADLGEALPLASDSYDTVVLTDVIEHAPYPDRLFAEVHRVLRPGGVAVIGVPFMYWLHEEPHDHFRYTSHRLRLFCDEHGLDVISLAPYGGGTDVLFDIAAKLLNQHFVTRRLVPPTVWVGERLGRSRATQPTALPLGYLLVAGNRDHGASSS